MAALHLDRRCQMGEFDVVAVPVTARASLAVKPVRRAALNTTVKLTGETLVGSACVAA